MLHPLTRHLILTTSCLLLAACSGKPGASGSAGARPGPPPFPVLHALDANRDGVISKEEIAAAPRALMTLDRNGDGQLTEAELMPRHPGGPGRPPRHRRGEGKAPLARSLAADPAEKRVLDVIARVSQQRLGMMQTPEQDARTLRLLVEALDAKHVVELGTSNGHATLWMAAGLLRTGGRITTFEYDASRAKLAREHLRQAGVEGRVTLVEGDAHEKVGALQGPIDLVFIDADKEGYLDYLRKLLPKLRPGGIVAAHNVIHPDPDPAFIKAITTDPALETLIVNTDGPGLSLSLKKRAVQP